MTAISTAPSPPATSPVAERRVLLVDDDPGVLHALRRSLRRCGLRVEIAESGALGLARLAELQPQVVVSDYKMPEMNGVDFLRAVKEQLPTAQRIMLTGYADQQAIEEAINRSEVFRFLSKPWDDGQLQLTLASAFEQFDVADENRKLLELTIRQNAELQALTQSLEIKVAERTRLLARAKDEWELTFDVIDRPIAVLDQGLAVVRANRAWAALAGVPLQQLQGGRCHELLFGRKTACAGCPLAEGKPPTARPLEIAAGERLFTMSAFATGEGGRSVCVYHDVTHERRVTLRTIQTEKLVAVGQLAGGVAHEINNPLGGILAFTQLMQRDAGRTPDDLEVLRDIEHAAIRCKRIVESLLKFGRRAPSEPALFDLNRAAEDAATLFLPQLRSKPRATFESDLGKDLPRVMGDVLGIEQVVLNLLVNALQALKGGEGRVNLSTRIRGEWAELCVADDGTGILPEHLPHLFEPTFTTKPPGEGTGLGLSIAWSIAESHGGRLDVASEPGKGTAFTLRLPLTLPV